MIAVIVTKSWSEGSANRLGWLLMAALLIAIFSTYVPSVQAQDKKTPNLKALQLPKKAKLKSTQPIKSIPKIIPIARRFTNFTEPQFTGERNLMVTVSALGLDQNAPLGRSPATGRLKVEFQYRTETENWNRDRRIIPKIFSETTPGKRKLKVVLPQRSSLSRSTRSSVPRQNSPLYSKNPIKFRTAETVYYRWVARNDKGRVVVELPERNFRMPRPFSVAILGDSFGAGEGAPSKGKEKRLKPASSLDVQGSNDEARFRHFAKWGDRGAHRSHRSGLVQAVKRFQKNNPDVWVEYIHTAISSATVGIGGDPDDENKLGMTKKFTGGREIFLETSLGANLFRFVTAGNDLDLLDELNNPQPAQVSIVERWVGEERIGYADVVLLSIGGNDAGFGDVINHSLFSGLDTWDDVRGWFSTNLENTDEAAEDLLESLENVILPKDRNRFVLWSNYPNLTRDENAQFKGLWQLPETVALGTATTAATAPGVAGAVIGSILAPFGGGALVAQSVVATEAVLAAANLNPWVLAMSLTISGNDLRNAERLLSDHLNPAVARWCEGSNSNRETVSECSVVDINGNSLRHGITARKDTRWFNTFINSSREICGGMDCSIHPNRAGYVGIYQEPFATELAQRYGRILEEEKNNPVDLTNLPIPSEKKLRLLAQERNEQMRKKAKRLKPQRALIEVIRDKNPDLRLSQDKIDDIVEFFRKVDAASIQPFLDRVSP